MKIEQTINKVLIIIIILIIILILIMTVIIIITDINPSGTGDIG